MGKDLLDQLKEETAVDVTNIDPKFLFSIAHKNENVKRIWWYSLESGDIRLSDKPEEKHSHDVFKDIAYKPGWIRGRVFEHDNKKFLMVYFVSETLLSSQLVDILDKVSNKLNTKINHVIDDKGNDISNILETVEESIRVRFGIEKFTSEMTTSADIAFAPQGGVSEPSEEDKELLKDKSGKLNKEREKTQLRKLNRRQEGLKEEMDARVPQLKREITNGLSKIIKEKPISAGTFAKAFPNSRDITPPVVMMKYKNEGKETGEVIKRLPDDVGELELTLEAVTMKKTIAGYEPFDAFKYLYGARFAVKEMHVPMIYEGYIDMNFAVQEYIYIGDYDTAEKVADVMRGTRVKNKIVYPAGGRFTPDFFNQLKEIIIKGEGYAKANN